MLELHNCSYYCRGDEHCKVVYMLPDPPPVGHWMWLWQGGVIYSGAKRPPVGVAAPIVRVEPAREEPLVHDLRDAWLVWFRVPADAPADGGILVA